MQQQNVQIILLSSLWPQQLELQVSPQITFADLLNYLAQSDFFQFSYTQLIVIAPTRKIVPHQTYLKQFIIPNQQLKFTICRKNKANQEKKNIMQNEDKKLQNKQKYQMNQIVVHVTVVDGQSQRTLSLPSFQHENFNDFKEALYKYIIESNLFNNWNENQQIKIYHKDKKFLKNQKPFSQLKIIKQGKVEFKIIRLYPGGK